MRKPLTAAATAIALLGSAQAASAAVVPANDHWGVVNRNVIGAASAELRTGPATPPSRRRGSIICARCSATGSSRSRSTTAARCIAPCANVPCAN